MLSKEEFVRIINKLKLVYDIEDEVDEIINKSSSNLRISEWRPVIEPLDEEIIFLLEKNMGVEIDEKGELDNSSIISWWIYETDFGISEAFNKIYNEDHTVYRVLDSAEKLYDYILEINGKGEKPC